MLLDNWAGMRTRFVKVFPHEYRRALKQAEREAQPSRPRPKRACRLEH